jgi:hypothetical protein
VDPVGYPELSSAALLLFIDPKAERVSLYILLIVSGLDSLMARMQSKAEVILWVSVPANCNLFPEA